MGWDGVMFLDGQQTGSRQPQGASSVTGAQEGRAQLDVMAPSVTMQLRCFYFLRVLTRRPQILPTSPSANSLSETGRNKDEV